MKKYLSENPTIAFGLGLPLLLVILFLMVSGIPRLIVDPPVHDVIYMTNSHNNLQIAVVNTKVQVTSHGHLGYNNKPRLWRYIAKTGAVQELAVILPANRNNNRNEFKEPPKPIVINVPDLDGLLIDSSSIAPDGYSFNSGSNNRSKNPFGGIFGSSYSSVSTLTKNGRSIRLPNSSTRYYYKSNQFVGWVISQ